MKRHPALEALSRDHHQALVVAQRLSRAGASDAAEAAAAFTEFFEHERRHFALEEDVLLPAFASRVLASDPMIVRTLTDHVAIRRDAAAVAAGGATEEVLHHLGRRLAAHVRFEERELFPRVETLLDEAALTALGEQLGAQAA